MSELRHAIECPCCGTLIKEGDGGGFRVTARCPNHSCSVPEFAVKEEHYVVDAREGGSGDTGDGGGG